MTNWLFHLIFAIRKSRLRKVICQLNQALVAIKDPIPCFVVAYNNYSYIKLMVDQLSIKGLTPIIFDNKSSDPALMNYLKSIHNNQAFVIFSNRNYGHKIGFLPGVYDCMPQFFAYTDPDLLFQDDLPTYFLDQLKALTIEYGVFKAGMALSLVAGDFKNDLFIKKNNNRSMPFSRTYSVQEWEQRYWNFKLDRQDELEIYAAPLDTTFAVYNKANYHGKFIDGIRVAGAYQAVHLPWFKDIDVMSQNERQKYLKSNVSSSWK
jgi:hypothetical protein